MAKGRPSENDGYPFDKVGFEEHVGDLTENSRNFRGDPEAQKPKGWLRGWVERTVQGGGKPDHLRDDLEGDQPNVIRINKDLADTGSPYFSKDSDDAYGHNRDDRSQDVKGLVGRFFQWAQ